MFLLFFFLISPIPLKHVPKLSLRGMDMRPHHPQMNITDIQRSIYKKQLVDRLTDPKRSINDKLALLYENDARFDPNQVRGPNLMAGGLSAHDFFAGF
jgi:hypothetical protein